MRSSHVFTAALVLACTGAAAAPAFAAGNVLVQIDHTVPVRLSGGASMVVIANPSIADASLTDGRQFVITGRNYGTTSVMVFDSAGRAIYNSAVTVSAPSSNHVSFYRGPIVQNLTCASHCERSAMPGEPAAVYQPYSTAAQDYATRAKSAAAAEGSGGPP